MAPDSTFWRHQLGDATNGLRSSLLKATLPICLSLSLFTARAEARTEFVKDTWGELSTSFLSVERPSLEQALRISPVPSPSVFFPTSPAGRWSNGNQIHIPNQPAVEKYIRFYKGQGRSTLMESLKRSWYYVPVMADILESQGVPAEMVAVVLVESCFKGRASHRGAGGYWQLLAATARSMGLRVDRWVDEREDPIKSTEAAAKYLRSFYEQYNCWGLALAAYNAGDAPVSRAVQRSGAKDYWELSKHRGLPGRTYAYVSKVLATIQILRDLESHGFDRSPQKHPVFDFETTTVRAPLKLEQVARWLDVPVRDLRDLNPSLRSDSIPTDAGFTLRLPSGSRDRFDVAYADYLRK